MLVIVLVIAAAAAGAWFSPALAIRSVVVVGASGDLSDQVHRIADQERGVPAPRTDLDALARRVETVSGVAHARVAREFPLDLKVTVTPRVAVLIATAPGQPPRLVDQQGVAYAPVPEGARPKVPVVPLRDSGQLRSAGLGALAEVMAVLPAGDRSSVRDVSLSSTGRISFRLGAVDVRWGAPGGSVRKARALETLRPLAAEQRAKVIDLSAPDRPVLS